MSHRGIDGVAAGDAAAPSPVTSEPSCSPPPLSADVPARALLEHALLLLARIQGGSAAGAASAAKDLKTWRQGSPAHEEAYQTALTIWTATDARGLQDRMPIPPTAAENRAQTRLVRRRTLTLLGLTGFSLLTAGSTRSYWSLELPRTLQTMRARLLTETMSDGTVIDLAANTTAVVSYLRDRRMVRLEAGAARFQVKPDSRRPFFVQTAWGHVKVLGTVFSVSAQGEMTVEVAEGRVGVWADIRRGDKAAGDAFVQLAAGQRLLVDEHGPGMVGNVAPSDVGAWRQGWLIFDNEPLTRAVSIWNDYLDPPLVLDNGAALRGLRLTGSFQIRHPEAFLSSLPGILPVAVVKLPSGVSAIVPKR